MQTSDRIKQPPAMSGFSDVKARKLKKPEPTAPAMSHNLDQTSALRSGLET